MLIFNMRGPGFEIRFHPSFSMSFMQTFGKTIIKTNCQAVVVVYIIWSFGLTYLILQLLQ